MLKKIFSFFDLDYQSVLESYIIARNPQNIGDVERLEREFERRCSSAYF